MTCPEPESETLEAEARYDFALERKTARRLERERNLELETTGRSEPETGDFMKAIIRVTRRTEYATIVEMTRKEFDAYCERLEGSYKDSKKAGEELNRKIDVKDWQDDEFDNIDEFEEVKEETE